MKTNRIMTRIHKWAGLVLGLQIFVWMGSGALMALFDINTVRGRHVTVKAPTALQTDNIIPIEIAMTRYPSVLDGAKLRMVVDSPVYELSGDVGLFWVDGQTGDMWRPLSEDVIRMAANAHYIGMGELVEIAFLDTAPIEYRGDLPVWQVAFNDPQNTRIYLHPTTGDLKATRTRLWRAFDVAWMLHIMDYDERDNFNNPLLRVASIAATLFVLTGFGLLWYRFTWRARLRRRARRDET